MRSTCSALAFVALLALPALASADSTQHAPDSVTIPPNMQQYEVPVPGNSIRVGGARLPVHAPLSVVRQVVTEYAKYTEFMPQFEKSHVIGRSPDGTDVYLRVTFLHGVAKIWAVMRFNAAESDDKGEHISGKMQGQGNVEDLRAVWRLETVDENTTNLALELFMVPKVPVPAWLVTQELVEAAKKGVARARERAEARFTAKAQGSEVAEKDAH